MLKPVTSTESSRVISLPLPTFVPGPQLQEPSLSQQLTRTTNRTQKILDENPNLKQKWISLIPQGKMGQPKDLMGPIAFLLSDASQYVTGADLRVDGGYTVT